MKMITQKEMAELLGVSNSHLYLMRLTHKIPDKLVVKKGRRVMFKLEAVEFLRSRIKKKR